jgi:hypothetical protein
MNYISISYQIHLLNKKLEATLDHKLFTVLHNIFAYILVEESFFNVILIFN